MSRRATCPICSKLFFHGCNYNNTRANLTCGPVCAAVQKVKRQKERRAEKRLARLHTQGLKKVIRTHGKPVQGPAGFMSHGTYRSPAQKQAAKRILAADKQWAAREAKRMRLRKRKVVK